MQLNTFANRLYIVLKERVFLFVYLPLTIYWLLIFISTSIPIDPVPRLFNAQDKVEHFTAYFILEVFLVFSLHFQNKYPYIKKRPILFSLILLALYAAVDEIHQYFIPGRVADILDWSADVLGGVLAIIITKLFLSKVQKDELIVK